jgi:hypothetical protein
LRQYWAHNGYSDQSFDGLPQCNPVSGIPPLSGPPPANPGCDPAFPLPNDCSIDASSPQSAPSNCSRNALRTPVHPAILKLIES